MAIQNIMETKIPELYTRSLYTEREYDLADEHTDKVLYSIVNGVSECLGDIKSKEYPVAFVFEENNLDFIIGAVVEYHKNEDESLPGNWSYIWTFDKADIPENARIVNIDNNMSAYFRGTADKKYGMGFKTLEALTELSRYLLRTISSWLDENAKEGEENGVQMEGTIIFRSTVEDGVIIKSAEPVGEVKVLIKGDAAIEAA